MTSHRSSSELEDGGSAGGGGIAAAAAISTARSRSREERRRRQSKVCGLGLIERGAGASLTACELGRMESFDAGRSSGLGRRSIPPKRDGIFFFHCPSRGHPELSLYPNTCNPIKLNYFAEKQITLSEHYPTDLHPMTHERPRHLDVPHTPHTVPLAHTRDARALLATCPSCSVRLSG